ncbi:hypothetical protein E2P79_09140 [Aeromonas schubertii]|nr:hypothetical protein E2P79_09140 [Aeromonas schubertii]
MSVNQIIPLLVNFFIKKIAKRMRRTITAIPADAMKMLVSLPWYGNIRELKNVIERAEQTGLTLAGFCRPGRAEIYSGHQRLLSE